MKTPKRDYKQDVCPKCGSVVHWYSEEVDNGTGYEIVNAYGECINSNCDFGVKGLRDHDGWEDHQQDARWMRKNREARLRHKIAVLQELVTELEHDCKERYEAVEELLQRDKDNCHEIAALKSANSELAIWLKQLCEQKAPELLNKQPIKRLMEKYAHERHRVPYSTFGQDVEGS